MKFPKDKAKWMSQGKGFDVMEYCENSPFPMDAAYVKLKDVTYPWKKHKDFHELYYIVKGTLLIEFEDGSKETLNEGDVYIMPPSKPHRLSAKEAELFVVCTPPFKQENMQVIGE